jgi:hypothetical protein
VWVRRRVANGSTVSVADGNTVMALLANGGGAVRSSEVPGVEEPGVEEP